MHQNLGLSDMAEHTVKHKTASPELNYAKPQTKLHLAQPAVLKGYWQTLIRIGIGPICGSQLCSFNQFLTVLACHK